MLDLDQNRVSNFEKSQSEMLKAKAVAEAIPRCSKDEVQAQSSSVGKVSNIEIVTKEVDEEQGGHLKTPTTVSVQDYIEVAIEKSLYKAKVDRKYKRRRK